jgi:hypothetical protein
MQTIRAMETTGKDGTLLLRIPLGKPETEYEVLVIVQATHGAGTATTPEERGWPSGYFEKTFGSITDQTFERPQQPPLPPPVDLDLERE